MLLLSRFRALERRELSLRRRFLKWSVKRQAFGTPAADEIRAYCVLFHAEVEAYVEDIARDGIEYSKGLLTNKNVANGVLFSLVACMHDVFGEGAISEADRLAASRTQKPKSRLDWVDLCGKQGHQLITSNHGIKEENITRMFRPLGVDLAALDQFWLAEMTQMGASRGSIAHDTLKIQAVPNLTDLKARVDLIMTGCGELREAMLNVCKTTVPATVALAAAAGPPPNGAPPPAPAPSPAPAA